MQLVILSTDRKHSFCFILGEDMCSVHLEFFLCLLQECNIFLLALESTFGLFVFVIQCDFVSIYCGIYGLVLYLR